MNEYPTVQVLMSTYNGEKFIDEQIDSIFSQECVNVVLLVRDDGSVDSTWDRLLVAKEKYGSKLCIKKGDNIGYRKSFLSLFNDIDVNGDYFAFSDQDDVWKPQKLMAGVYMLSHAPSAWLYASALTIANEKLEPLSTSYKNDVKQSLGSFFVRTRLAGCTMIFKPELAKKAQIYSNLQVDNEKMPDHDCLLCMLCMLYNREICIDNDSYILHRRHDAAETSGGRGFTNRIRVEYNRVFKRKDSYLFIAQLLLEKVSSDSDGQDWKDQAKLLELITSYKSSLIKTIQLMASPQISCGVLAADVLIRTKMMLRIY